MWRPLGRWLDGIARFRLDTGPEQPEGGEDDPKVDDDDH